MCLREQAGMQWFLLRSHWLESTVVCKTKWRAKNLHSNSISCPSLLAAYISGWRCENVRHKVEWTNELDLLPFWRWTRRILERAIGWHVPERTAKAQSLETDSLLSLHGALCQDISDVSHQSESDPIQMVSGLEFRLSTSFDLCDTLCHSRLKDEAGTQQEKYICDLWRLRLCVAIDMRDMISPGSDATRPWCLQDHRHRLGRLLCRRIKVPKVSRADALEMDCF